MYAIFVLLDQILLTATLVGMFGHNLCGGSCVVVGDVKESSGVVEQTLLALQNFQGLPDNDHAVVTIAGDWTVIELGNMLHVQANVLELTLLDNLLFDFCGASARFGFHLVPWLAVELFPRVLRQFFGNFIKLGHRVDSKNELHIVIVPAIQMRRLRKVRVASQANFAKTGAATELDRSIKVGGRTFVTGAVAAAVEQIQRLVGVGQRNHQRMITPLVFVIDVDALFALAASGDHRTVAVDTGFVEELIGLLLPDFHASFVEDFLQGTDRVGIKPSAEVASSSRVRNPHRVKCIEISFIVAAILEMFQAGTARQNVVGDIENVIGLGVRQVKFQQRDAAIDLPGKFESIDHLMNQSDSTARNGLLSLCDFVMNVGGLEFGALSPRRR